MMGNELGNMVGGAMAGGGWQGGVTLSAALRSPHSAGTLWISWMD